MQDLRDYLHSGHLLLADGATGTMFQEMGLEPGAAPDLWNIQRPEAVRSLHRAYLDAGSQIILTNTFGGNRIRLALSGVDAELVPKLNRAGARLAVAETAGQAYVAGDIGPTGELLAPFGTLGFEEAVQVYAEQAKALAEGGVDLIWIETMSDLQEAQAAIEGAHRAADLPVFCSLTFQYKKHQARTMMGVSPLQAAETLWPLGLMAIGANCGEGLEVIFPVLREMRAALPKAALIAKPNAGIPRLDGDRTVYDLTPMEMGGYVPQLIDSGAQIIGGCCGNTPDHIAAMAVVMDQRRS
jgi:5-methyltetrahydrofolate--homocysteine methyltransferase